MNVVHTTHVVFFFEKPWITINLRLECWMNLGDGWSIHLELCFLKHFADPFLSQKSAGDWGCLTRIRCTEAMSFCAMPCLRSALRRGCILSQLRPKMMRCIYIYVYEVYLWGINMRICEVQHMWGICEVYMRCICEVFMWGVCIYI